MEFKVLVVDDEEVIVEFVRKVLKKINSKIEIHTASDADEAIIAITGNRGAPFNPVITDIDMPGMYNGFDVIFQAKEMAKRREEKIKVLAMSGNPENCKKALEEGADIFIEKPLSVNSFIGHIKAFFSSITK